MIQFIYSLISHGKTTHPWRLVLCAQQCCSSFLVGAFPFLPFAWLWTFTTPELFGTLPRETSREYRLHNKAEIFAFSFSFSHRPGMTMEFLINLFFFLLIFLRIIIPLPHSLPQHLLTSAEKLWRKQSNKAEIFVLYVDDVSRWPIFHLCSLRLLASVLGTTQCVLSPLQWRHKFSILFLSLLLAVNWNRSPLGYRSGGSKIK